MKRPHENQHIRVKRRLVSQPRPTVVEIVERVAQVPDIVVENRERRIAEIIESVAQTNSQQTERLRDYQRRINTAINVILRHDIEEPINNRPIFRVPPRIIVDEDSDDSIDSTDQSNNPILYLSIEHVSDDTLRNFVPASQDITPFDNLDDLTLPDEKSNEKRLPKIQQYQLLKLLSDSSQIYDCLDLSEGRFVTARRLEEPKHLRRLQLASRLNLNVDTEDTRRLHELLIPQKTTWLSHREKDTNDSKLYYYWFEPPNHGSLHTYVIERKRLPEVQSKEYFRQICQLVEFCHQRGIVMRDLKLRRFVFADSNRSTVKWDDLDDTEICPEKDIEDDLLSDRRGCPAYVSPEMLDLSKTYYSGKSADLWSLGVLLYVLLVGRYPFYDVTPGVLFARIRRGYIHLSDQDGVRLEARLLIRAMLRRDPKERPTVTEVLANSWLLPKDYWSAFKEFDCSECVFWKPRSRLDQQLIIASRPSDPHPSKYANVRRGNQ